MSELSIIVRVHNDGKKLDKTIKSILSDSLDNYEIIIVDDGSTDGSSAICDSYLKFKQVRVIHQENRGSLLAILSGFNNAQSEYVTLVDCGDWCEKSYVQDVLSVLHNVHPDMLLFDYKEMHQDGTYDVKRWGDNSDYFSQKETAIRFLKTTNYALWNKVIKREKAFFSQEEIDYFTSSRYNTNLGDDLYILMPILCKCSNIYYYNKTLYNYLIETQSISHNGNVNIEEDFSNRLALMNRTYEVLNNSELWDSNIKKLLAFDTIEFIYTDFSYYLKNFKFSIKKHVSDEQKDFLDYVFNNIDLNKDNNSFSRKKRFIIRSFERLYK